MWQAYKAAQTKTAVCEVTAVLVGQVGGARYVERRTSSTQRNAGLI